MDNRRSSVMVYFAALAFKFVTTWRVMRRVTLQTSTVKEQISCCWTAWFFVSWDINTQFQSITSFKWHSSLTDMSEWDCKFATAKFREFGHALELPYCLNSRFRTDVQKIFSSVFGMNLTWLTFHNVNSEASWCHIDPHRSYVVANIWLSVKLALYPSNNDSSWWFGQQSMLEHLLAI